METDDDEARPRDEVSFGDQPRGRMAAALSRWAASLRNRLGGWFGPAIAATVTALAVVIALAVVLIDDPAEPAAADPPPASSTPQSTPSPSPPTSSGAPRSPLLPDGPPPALPYYADGVLTWPTGSMPTPRRELASLVSRAGVSLAVLRTGQRITEVPSSGGPIGTGVASGPAIGPAGSFVAWTTARGGPSGRLVLWDMARQRRVASQPIRLDVACCDHPGIQVVGIDAANRVYLSADQTFLVWSPAAHSIDVIAGTERYAAMSAVTPAGPVFVRVGGSGSRGRAVYGTLDDASRFRPVGQVHSANGAWSPGGDTVAHLITPTAAVVHPIDGLAVSLQTPEDWTINDLAWESEAAVLVVISRTGSNSSWLRCGAATGVCEVAANLGDPMRSGDPWLVADNNPPQYR